MRWTLRRKIFSGYGIVLLLMALVLGWALAGLLRLGSSSGEILNENYQSIRAADDMIRALERQDSGVLLYLLGYEEEGQQQFQQYQMAFSEQLGQAKGNVTIEGERAVLARIDTTYRKFVRELRAVERAGAAPDSAYRNRMLPAFLEVRRAVDRLRRLNQQTMQDASGRTQRVAARATWSVGGVGVGALLLGLLFSVVLSNRLVRPLRRVRAAVEQVAGGDYDVTVRARSSDELGRLADAFNGMAAQLQHFRTLNLERITAEQRKTDAVVESIDDGLIAVDAGGRILNMNPAAARLFEADAHESTGHHFLEVVDDRALFAHVAETISTGQPPQFEREEDFLTTQHDGRTRHFQFSVSPVRGPGATQQGAVLLLNDVTRLRELDRLKSEFVATASHELKTPLMSIGMSIELLTERLEDTLDDTNAELMQTAGTEVERLRVLVEELLDLSRIESGHAQMHPEPTPLRPLAERVLENARAQAEKQDVALALDVPAHLPPARADRAKVQQVLVNLLSNALRHTGPGDRVRLWAEAAGPQTVRLAVEDSGPGIPADEQAHLFDKFVQIESDRAVGGSGLGLAISKEIVERHGGEIGVDSTPGEGATFWFTLPQAGDEAHDEPSQSAGGSSSG